MTEDVKRAPLSCDLSKAYHQIADEAFPHLSTHLAQSEPIESLEEEIVPENDITQGSVLDISSLSQSETDKLPESIGIFGDDVITVYQDSSLV